MISDDGKIKLCDFGSCTTKVYKPDENWTSQQRALLEDKVIILKIWFMYQFLLLVKVVLLIHTKIVKSDKINSTALKKFVTGTMSPVKILLYCMRRIL